ncbi:T9SS type A sorting domain-containing protein [Tenacibaculum sp. ZS6-P6]|uniref:T9SS type A sorting domain-containing protein n=1 Tax=Tenacibaculum sp. ZS6-P6 TaxID=3447503 RepID=UPI003F991AA2
MKVIDKNNVYISSFHGYPFKRRIHHSKDGGLTWSEIYDERSSFFSFDFVDIKNGYFVNDKSGEIYFGSTNNGGESWTIKKISLCSSCGTRAYKIFFEDTNNGFIITNEAIINTSDGGATWNKNSSFSLRDFKIDKSTGKGIGTADKKIYKTSNYGRDWIKSFDMPTSGSVESYSVIDLDAQNNVFTGIYDYGDSGYPSGTEGAIFRIPENKVSYQRIYQNNQEFTSIASFDNKILYAYNRENKYIYKIINYKDANINPTFEKDFEADKSISEIIIREDYGYAFSYYGDIYKLDKETLSIKDDLLNNNFNIFTKENKVILELKNNNFQENILIKLYSMKGELINQLENINLNLNNSKIIINKKPVSSGVYIVVIKSEKEEITKKILLNFK